MLTIRSHVAVVCLFLLICGTQWATSMIIYLAPWGPQTYQFATSMACVLHGVYLLSYHLLLHASLWYATNCVAPKQPFAAISLVKGPYLCLTEIVSMIARCDWPLPLPFLFRASQ